MQNKSTLMALTLISCLTICQVGYAQSSNQAPLQRVSQKQTLKPAYRLAATDNKSASENINDQLSSADSGMSNQLSNQVSYRQVRSFSGPAKSVVFDIPASGEFVFETEYGQRDSEVSYTFESDPGLWSRVDIKQNFHNGKIAVSYGLSRNIYFGVSAFYLNGKSDYVSSSFSGERSSGSSKMAGLSEPSIRVGVHGLLGRHRLIGQVSGLVPVGPEKTAYSDDGDRHDALAGGGSISPSLMLISHLESVRLINAVEYTHEFEKRSEQTGEYPGRVEKFKTTGGNSFQLATGFEVPKALNWGVLLSWKATESSKATEEASPGIPAGSTYTNLPTTLTTVATYLGIKAADRFLIVPKIAYSSMKKEADPNETVSPAEIWAFNLSAKAAF